MPINWESLKADIGGRWFLDRKSMAAIVPYLVLTSMLSSSTLSAQPELWEGNLALRYPALLLANFVSIAICWGYLELAAATVFRNRSKRPIHWIAVVFFSASLGFLKGLTTGLFSYTFGSELDLEIAITNRVLQTSILGLWTVPVVTLAAATFSRYKAEREALVNERVDQAMRDHATGEIPKHQVALRRFLDESKIRVSQIRQDNSGQQDRKAIAQTLRSMIETGLRPISHQIWLSETNARSGFGIRDLTLLALSKNPFPLAVIGVGFAIGLLPLNLVAFETGKAILGTFVTVTVALACYAFFIFFQSRLRVNALVVFLIGNSFAAVFSILVTAITFGDPLTAETGVLGLALWLWLVQLSFFGSVIGEVLSTRADIRAELEALTGSAGIASAVDRAANKLASRDLAQHVHSNIQNQLLAAALKLEQGEVSKAELEAQLTEVEKLLELALVSNRASVSGSLSQNIDEIVARWQGFVDIEVQFDSLDSGTSEVVDKYIAQIISEAISNSVRHGLAARIWISINVDQATNQVQVTIRDDGLGPRAGAAGLGTELFNSVAPGGWSIELLEGGGALLSITFQRQ